jgi:hypothetical protein
MSVLLNSLSMMTVPNLSTLSACVNKIAAKFCQECHLVYGRHQDAVEFMVWVINTYFKHAEITGPFEVWHQTSTFCQTCDKEVSVSNIHDVSYWIKIDLNFVIDDAETYPVDKPVTLKECLDSTFSYTYSGNSRCCPNCGNLGTCSLKTTIRGTWPNFLFLNLQRAAGTTDDPIKVVHAITYEDVMEMSSPNGQKTVYHLHSVQRHIGAGASFGHYYVETTDGSTNWRELNDGDNEGLKTEGRKLQGGPQDRLRGTETMLVYVKRKTIDHQPTKLKQKTRVMPDYVTKTTLQSGELKDNYPREKATIYGDTREKTLSPRILRFGGSSNSEDDEGSWSESSWSNDAFSPITLRFDEGSGSEDEKHVSAMLVSDCVQFQCVLISQYIMMYMLIGNANQTDCISVTCKCTILIIYFVIPLLYEAILI